MSEKLLKQLQAKTSELGGIKFCQHTLLSIIFPDNRTANFPPCDICNLPRLKATLDFDDNRLTPRKLERARRAFAASAVKFPHISKAERRTAVAAAYGIDENLL